MDNTNMYDMTDPDELDDNVEFQMEMQDIEAKGGKEAREMVEKYIRATITMNGIRHNLIGEDNTNKYMELFDQDDRIMIYMRTAAILVQNAMATVKVGAITPEQGVVLISTLIGIGMVVGYEAETSERGEIEPGLDDIFSSFLNNELDLSDLE